jgi:hypothetical protein
MSDLELIPLKADFYKEKDSFYKIPNTLIYVHKYLLVSNLDTTQTDPLQIIEGLNNTHYIKDIIDRHIKKKKRMVLLTLNDYLDNYDDIVSIIE